MSTPIPVDGPEKAKIATLVGIVTAFLVTLSTIVGPSGTAGIIVTSAIALVGAIGAAFGVYSVPNSKPVDPSVKYPL